MRKGHVLGMMLVVALGCSSSPPASDDIVWIRTVNMPDEQRARVTGEWHVDGGVNRIATTVRIGYEHVTRWNFTSATRSSVLGQIKLEYRP